MTYKHLKHRLRIPEKGVKIYSQPQKIILLCGAYL